MSNVADWAVDTVDNDDSRQFPTTSASGNKFLTLLFEKIFDVNKDGWITFAEILTGLTQMVHSAASLRLFFLLHLSRVDGELSKEDTIVFSETLLFMFRKMEGDLALGAVSAFLNRAFLIPAKQAEDGTPLEWSISFEIFQALIMTDDILVEFFVTFPSTLVLLNSKSGVYTTVKAPVLEIADSIMTGGFKWASRFTGGMKKAVSVNLLEGKVVEDTLVVASPVDIDLPIELLEKLDLEFGE